MHFEFFMSSFSPDNDFVALFTTMYLEAQNQQTKEDIDTLTYSYQKLSYADMLATSNEIPNENRLAFLLRRICETKNYEDGLTLIDILLSASNQLAIQNKDSISPTSCLLAGIYTLALNDFLMHHCPPEFKAEFEARLDKATNWAKAEEVMQATWQLAALHMKNDARSPTAKPLNDKALLQALKNQTAYQNPDIALPLFVDKCFVGTKVRKSLFWHLLFDKKPLADFNLGFGIVQKAYWQKWINSKLFKKVLFGGTDSFHVLSQLVFRKQNHDDTQNPQAICSTFLTYLFEMDKLYLAGNLSTDSCKKHFLQEDEVRRPLLFTIGPASEECLDIFLNWLVFYSSLPIEFRYELAFLMSQNLQLTTAPFAAKIYDACARLNAQRVTAFPSPQQFFASQHQSTVSPHFFASPHQSLVPPNFGDPRNHSPVPPNFGDSCHRSPVPPHFFATPNQTPATIQSLPPVDLSIFRPF